MKIRNLLSFVAGLVLVVFVGSTFFIYSSLKNYQAAVKKEAVANQIAGEVFQRRLLADDYLLNPTDRAKQQWLSRQSVLADIVSKNSGLYTKSGESEQISIIESALKDSDKTFNTLVKIYSDSTLSQSIVDEQKARLSSQLTVIAIRTTEASDKLQTLNHKEAATTLNRIVLLFIIIAITLMGILLFSFVVIWRSAGKLANREAENSAMLGSIGDGVFAIDKNKKIILFNPSAEQITGYKVAESIGRKYDEIFNFLDEKTGEKIEEFINMALKGSKTALPSRSVLKQKDGKIVPVADSAAPIVTKTGEIMGAVVVFRDVTAERELETAKDDFLSLASHQLRTPATAVKQNLGLIIEGYAKSSKDVAEFIHEAYDSNDEQLQIIDDILNVSKLDAGKLELKIESVNINDLLDHAVSELVGQSRAKGHILTLHKTMNDILLNVDKLKIMMSVQNLISNAIKYTPENGHITVDLSETEDKVYISVVDDGIGISPEDQKKLFNKFSRIQSDYTIKVQGTGLGLYLVKQIVEMHGGKIIVEQNQPKGSKFIVALPKNEV